MANSLFPRLIFPADFDDRAEDEAEQRGLADYIVVELEDGKKYGVCFFTPHRLGLELSSNEEMDEPCVGEPGLIVISKVTREAMEVAIRHLHKSGYFSKLVPLDGSGKYKH